MSDHTIDTALARRMIEANAIRGASIIGRPGGWSVMLKLGEAEKPLSAQRTGKPRTWRSLDTCVEYLKTELHIVRVELLDASGHSANDAARTTRADSSERLKHAHEAAAHDKWFRAQVEQAIREADDPDTAWVPHDVVKKDMAKQRKALKARIAAGAK